MTERPYDLAYRAGQVSDVARAAEQAGGARCPVAVGDRVRIVGVMHDDPDPLPVGAEGTVDYLGSWKDVYTEQIGVKWDNGRSLMLLPHDPFEVIS